MFCYHFGQYSIEYIHTYTCIIAKFFSQYIYLLCGDLVTRALTWAGITTLRCWLQAYKMWLRLSGSWHCWIHHSWGTHASPELLLCWNSRNRDQGAHCTLRWLGLEQLSFKQFLKHFQLALSSDQSQYQLLHMLHSPHSSCEHRIWFLVEDVSRHYGGGIVYVSCHQ